MLLYMHGRSFSVNHFNTIDDKDRWQTSCKVAPILPCGRMLYVNIWKLRRDSTASNSIFRTRFRISMSPKRVPFWSDHLSYQVQYYLLSPAGSCIIMLLPKIHHLEQLTWFPASNANLNIPMSASLKWLHIFFHNILSSFQSSLKSHFTQSLRAPFLYLLF